MTESKMLLNSEVGAKWAKDSKILKMSVGVAAVGFIGFLTLGEVYEGKDPKCIRSNGEQIVGMPTVAGLILSLICGVPFWWLLAHQTNGKLMSLALTTSMGPAMIWLGCIRANLATNYVRFKCFPERSSSILTPWLTPLSRKRRRARWSRANLPISSSGRRTR